MINEDADRISDAETVERLDQWSSIRVSGADRVAFLQGQLTQDIARIRPDQPMLAGWASNKGRLLCVCWVVDWQESLWLILPRERCAAVSQRLRMFVLRSAVTIEPTDQTVQLVCRNNVTSEEREISSCLYNDSFYYFPLSSALPESSLPVGLALGSVIRNSREPRPNSGIDADIIWRRSLIESGIPTVYDDTAGNFVPQMVNLDLINAISFSKGCYVGQEIVARTHNLGRIKRRMFAYQCASTQPLAGPGDELYADGQVAGSVVDSAPVAEGQQMLGVIKLTAQATELRLKTADGPLLQRIELPYTVPLAD